MMKPVRNGARNTIETILVVLLLLSLFLAMYDVLKIFFNILTFALIFSVSFAGLFEKGVSLLGGRRKLAAFIYSVILIAIIAVPFIYFISVLRQHIREAIDWVNEIKTNGLPPLPAWIANLPLVGGDIASFWSQLQHSPKDAIAHHEEQIKLTLRHMANSGIGMVGTALQFIAGIIISSFFMSSGEKMLAPVKLAMQHLLGKRNGLSLLRATTQAIKGVSIGVIGTALIASIISWIGLTIAGIKLSLILSAMIFFLVLIQLGPLLVWIPLVIWSAVEGHTGMTIFLIIYGILLLIIDAFLKPILIARSGGKLPFLVLFLGVVGGLAAWGFTGMFKGAIILAIFYTVFNTWLEGKASPGAPREALPQ